MKLNTNNEKAGRNNRLFIFHNLNIKQIMNNLSKNKPTKNTKEIPVESSLVVTFPAFTSNDKLSLSNSVEELKKKISNYKIVDQQTRENASAFLSAVRGKWKELDAKRDKFVRPLNEEVSSINNEFKAIQQPLVDFGEILKAEIKRDYEEQQLIQRKKEMLIREEEYKRIAAAQKDLKSKNDLVRQEAVEKITAIQTEADAKINSAAPVKTIHTSHGSTSVKKVWKWKLIDFKKVPDNYKVINEKMLNAVVKASSGNIEIPGIEIYSESNVGVRT